MSACFCLCFRYYAMCVIQQYILIFISIKFMLFFEVVFNGLYLPELNLCKFQNDAQINKSALLLKNLESRYEKKLLNCVQGKKPHQANSKLVSYCSLISLSLCSMICFTVSPLSMLRKARKLFLRLRARVGNSTGDSYHCSSLSVENNKHFQTL